MPVATSLDIVRVVGSVGSSMNVNRVHRVTLESTKFAVWLWVCVGTAGSKYGS